MCNIVPFPTTPSAKLWLKLRTAQTLRDIDDFVCAYRSTARHLEYNDAVELAVHAGIRKHEIETGRPMYGEA